MKTEIEMKLEILAQKSSTKFCYGCYQDARNGVCAKCGSDDLMNTLAGVGLEYGLDWIVEHILAEKLTAVDVSQDFETMIRESYSDTTEVGFIALDTVDTMKTMDPISWKCAVADYESSQLSDDVYFTPDNGTTIYYASEVEALVSDVELDKGGG